MGVPFPARERVGEPWGDAVELGRDWAGAGGRLKVRRGEALSSSCSLRTKRGPGCEGLPGWSPVSMRAPKRGPELAQRSIDPRSRGNGMLTIEEPWAASWASVGRIGLGKSRRCTL
jgi:hypothetical protein